MRPVLRRQPAEHVMHFPTLKGFRSCCPVSARYRQLVLHLIGFRRRQRMKFGLILATSIDARQLLDQIDSRIVLQAETLGQGIVR